MKTLTLEFSSHFRAMNTGVEVLLYPRLEDRPGRVKAIQDRASGVLSRVRRLFEDVEQRLSRFQPDSELSRLNRSGQLTGVSTLLFENIREALALAEVTGGIYEPAILDALEAAGYSASFEQVAAGRITTTARQVALPEFGRYRDIRLDPATRSVTLPAGTRLDLGGIAKGWTVDRAARMLRQAGFRHFMVSAGGDMYLSGTPYGRRDGWEIGLLNPVTLEGNLRDIQARDRAVATSAVTKRRWTLAGQERHHLIDPRSGRPVENNLASVTVLAPSVRQADVFAKTVLILGPEEGRRFIDRQPGCAAIFAGKDLSIF